MRVLNAGQLSITQMLCGYGARASITLRWCLSMPCCTMDTWENRCSRYIHMRDCLIICVHVCLAHVRAVSDAVAVSRDHTAYNAMDDSPIRSRGWFTHPHRLTMRRTICSSAPAYNIAADSSIGSRGRLGRD